MSQSTYTSSTTINILGYDFMGPIFDLDRVADYAGVYVVLTKASLTNNNWRIIDVGESGSVRTRLKSHDRKPQWKRRSLGMLGFGVLYTSSNRLELENLVRGHYRPECGER